MSDEKQVATDGMLIKRPILVGEDFMLAGFREAEWESKFRIARLGSHCPKTERSAPDSSPHKENRPNIRKLTLRNQ